MEDMSKENLKTCRLTDGTLVFGPTGKGKSGIIQQYADKEGISYEEAESRIEATAEENGSTKDGTSFDQED